MKILANHLLLFDAECPVCDAYSNALVKQGLIDKNGRKSYQQELEVATCPLVDRQRAVNEIALVNLETGEVSYGAESILRIYASRYPVVHKVISVKLMMWILNKLYAFISLNRRMVIPVKQQDGLQPQFKLHYRVAYLMITWFLTSFILTQYAIILDGVVPVGGAFREYLICGGQIVCQGFVVGLIAHEKRWDYLGNMMTISFAGALLLGIMLIASNWLGNLPVVYLSYFLLVAGAMFIGHIRRSKLLQLGWWLTITWVVYRLVVLVLILI
ncbi:DCC1-like thiol-disulfide oxidoreductase family protein [Mucilaginibacter auburnensis]|uniref:Uncharacterized protein DUF393 n=1 Tax=Mucilaginibacter auburnensis TaxID=1457233 RepID=A0A2H9VVT6_9SPHI|nr:DCC1-like thiol-disulfide oxidoreductase family protein [Mucilaginibacter auburnensis]PJJ84927.1 uncharacterized protein DUF393 [Mucilaginibacter auburnensis]